MKTLAEFTQAYEGLGDALLTRVVLAYTKENQPQIIVVVECMSALVDYDWVNLELRFWGVQEYCLVSKANSSLVVIESFAANQFGEVFVFDFAPTVIPPETMEEHQQSRFYIACAGFDYQELEWSES